MWLKSITEQRQNEMEIASEREREKDEWQKWASKLVEAIYLSEKSTGMISHIHICVFILFNHVIYFLNILSIIREAMVFSFHRGHVVHHSFIIPITFHFIIKSIVCIVLLFFSLNISFVQNRMCLALSLMCTCHRCRI